jgi:pimeloyl-ACP methyl ester carboxylesterase
VRPGRRGAAAQAAAEAAISTTLRSRGFTRRSLNRTAFLSGQRSTEHRPLIKVPTVFTHSTADPFGSIDELRAAAALIPAPSEIVEVTGARHDLGSKTLDVPVLAVDAALRLLP